MLSRMFWNSFDLVYNSSVKGVAAICVLGVAVLFFEQI